MKFKLELLSKSFLQSAIVSAIYYKFILARLYYGTYKPLEMTAFFPSVFYQDFLLFFGLYWSDVYLIRKFSTAALLCYALLSLVKLAYVILLATCTTAVFISGVEFDVSILYKVIADWKNFSKLASSKEESLLLATNYLVYFALLTLILIVNFVLDKKRMNYQPISTKKVGKRKILNLIVGYGIYLLVSFVIRPQWPYHNMSNNILFKFITVKIPNPFENPRASRLGRQSIQAVDTGNLTMQTVRDFSFLDRTNNSEIRNVLWLTLESMRGEVFPFNYNSTFAKTVLTENAMLERNITPFMEKFTRECAYTTNASTATSYTIKSILSMQCSMYPYPSDFISEDERTYYKKCLPKLLKEHGFDTIFMEPCTVFDKLDKILAKMDLPLYGKEEIDQEFDGPAPYETINYFGYSDEIILDRMFDWIKKRTESNTPFFLSGITNTNHHPFNSPKSWNKNGFANQEHTLANDYINTVAYTESIVERLVEFLKESGLSKNTLLVLNGDHGMALGEKGMVGATNRLAVTFKVPIILWTENEIWKSRLQSRQIEGDRFSLDIVPTILDILNHNYTSDTRFDYGYEGDSLVHPFVKKPRFGFSNPGIGSMHIREDGLKLSIDTSGLTALFDLNQDPDENNEIDMTAFAHQNYSRWYNRARQMLKEQVEYLKDAYDQ
ncbi:hypothetical protein HDV04_002207 [Boothiomyces sp. JEL0838]|nr:hypothetical protein HDV04_002207 [Boothiomyces sp. JEL0838]